jgi:hypothetical protein
MTNRNAINTTNAALEKTVINILKRFFACIKIVISF